ncbi:small ribosomal subunit Rsm22 family protein [Streptomyces montanisoli]|uniref:rRNA methyltransferase n=1 Tax=Streptomyces montanisoli TaxID=2798581 RepID=A0A940MCJ8_9ACTN|nr:small ribosomal subunit Rsm22 family protein [Streptomyces montanisoli]MBP0460485.1 rRNA methyltransferase [Streptomyces montanisoli]
MNATPPTSETLRAALAGLLEGLPPARTAAAVDRLIATYRGTTPTHTPVLRDASDAAAYAAYRMPATFEAERAALGALADAVPGWAPGRHVDVGGGTGAAVWAAAATWPGSRTTTVLDWAEPALAAGRDLAAGVPGLRDARWTRARIGGAGGELPACDLLTVGYVLKELTPDDRTALVAGAARAARAVVVVEPGTPDGYERIMEARDLLIGAGLRIAAPCPHDGACPIERGADWCHFAARVGRSSLHRQVKGGSLPYEDEKFSYVAAVRLPEASGSEAASGEEAAVSPAPARVVRRPMTRKGQVLLDLCTVADGLRRETVTKRRGAEYRAARSTDWGDAWPPPQQEPQQDGAEREGERDAGSDA